MIDRLRWTIDRFGGAQTRTRCFLHTVNLVAKSMLKQFDVPKKNVEAAIDEAEKTLLALAEGLDQEEAELRAGGQVPDSSEGFTDEEIEEYVNEAEVLTDEEQERLREDVASVRLLLVKVSVVLYLQMFGLTCPLPSSSSPSLFPSALSFLSAP